MPKLKTHQGMKKRIKLTATGKLLHRRAFKSHLLEKKSASRKRGYAKEHVAHDSDKANIKRMLGV